MTRRQRIAVELLAPAPVATAVAFGIAVARDPRALVDLQFLGGALVVLLFAYVFAAIPSLLFALALELAFRRGLDPASWAAVLLAAGLGLVAGMAMVGFDPSYGMFTGFALLGVAAGGIVGALVRWRTRRAAAPRP